MNTQAHLRWPGLRQTGGPSKEAVTALLLKAVDANTDGAAPRVPLVNQTLGNRVAKQALTVVPDQSADHGAGAPAR